METQTQDTKYAEGFNKGYILFKYEQDIAQSFIDNDIAVHDNFSDGFKKGLLHAQQERTINEFEQIRNKNKDQDHNLER